MDIPSSTKDAILYDNLEDRIASCIGCRGRDADVWTLFGILGDCTSTMRLLGHPAILVWTSHT